MAWSSRSPRQSAKYYIAMGHRDEVTRILDCATNGTISEHATYEDARKELDRLNLEALKTSVQRKRSNKYDTGEIPHLWVHQIVPSAENRQGNLFFRDGTIYSYGTHFPIAMHVTGERKGSHAILFTTSDYSNTTSMHKGIVRNAIPKDVQVFHVPSLSDRPSHRDNIGRYSADITKAINTAARARKAYAKDYNMRDAKSLIAEAKQYAKFFGLAAPKLPKLPKDWNELAGQLRKDAAKQAAENKRKDAARKAQAIKDAAKAIEQWRNGANVHVPHDVPAMLRIKEVTTDGDTSELVVQTSKGVNVPLDHARRALFFIRRVMELGVEYKRNGHTFHIGHYQIDRVSTDGTLYAGCHVITWDEIQKLAPQLDATE